MENLTTILIVLFFYTGILLLNITSRSFRPGVASYHTIRQGDLCRLNGALILNALLMLTPLWIVKRPPTYLLIFPDKISIGQAVAFLVCFGLIALLPWKKLNTDNLEEIVCTRGEGYSYAISRAGFLIIYEWFFRGLILISFCNWFGNIAGVAVNILLYVTLHFYKSKREMIGCIPLGVLLCLFTIWWQSVWPAIIFHLQIAIINEYPLVQQFVSPQKQAAV